MISHRNLVQQGKKGKDMKSGKPKIKKMLDPDERAHKRPASSIRKKPSENFLSAEQHIDVMQFMDYRDFLSKFYEAIKTTRKSYSYPRFAAALGLSETTALWQVLARRRDLSEASADKITENLQWSIDEKKHFLLLVKHNNSRDPELREICMKELLRLRLRSVDNSQQEKLLEYFEEWYNPVIREMTGLDEFNPNPDWINERLFLKVTPRRIAESLDLLTKLELVRFDPDLNRYMQTGKQITLERNVQAISAVRYHQKACEIARESVMSVATHRRDLNVLTLCISDESFNDIKQTLHDACRKILEIENRPGKKSDLSDKYAIIRRNSINDN